MSKLSRMPLNSTGLTSEEDRSVWTKPTLEGVGEGIGAGSEEIFKVGGVALAIEVGVEEVPGSHPVTMRSVSRIRPSL